VLLAFYDCPSEHWIHLDVASSIESMFATLRLRTRHGCRFARCKLAMVFMAAWDAREVHGLMSYELGRAGHYVEGCPRRDAGELSQVSVV
jgi:hypothetical protein